MYTISIWIKCAHSFGHVSLRKHIYLEQQWYAHISYTHTYMFALINWMGFSNVISNDLSLWSSSKTLHTSLHIWVTAGLFFCFAWYIQPWLKLSGIKNGYTRYRNDLLEDEKQKVKFCKREIDITIVQRKVQMNEVRIVYTIWNSEIFPCSSSETFV